MGVSIPTRGLIPAHASSKSPSTPPAEEDPQFPGTITTSPNRLDTLDLTHPILRFSFPTAAAQTAFHHAFPQLRTPRDRAAFMERYFDNYEGVVDIPRRIHMDTSNDEEMARRLAEEEEERLRGDVREMAEGDEKMARELQEGLGVEMETEGDEALAARLEEEEEEERERLQREQQSGGPGVWENDRGRQEERRMRTQQTHVHAPLPSPSHTPTYNHRNHNTSSHPDDMTALTDRFSRMTLHSTRHHRPATQSFTTTQPSVRQRGGQFANGPRQSVLEKR
ncbi:hypothetical protein A1F95_08954 [Pyrenophora tritici-repentis]|nr:hypothetical protein A1F95_08954 [Pyrenophora tritici-repentis]